MSERLNLLEAGRAHRGRRSRGQRWSSGGDGRRTGGRSRRRRRVRQACLALVGLVALAGALLGIMASRASGPARIAYHGRAAAGQGGATAPPASAGRQSAQAPSLYGSELAPASDRVNVVLKRGLRSGLLFDVHTGQVLWRLHPDRVLAIASLTKMMTALVVVTHSRPTDRVLITPQAVDFSGSGVGLLPVRKRVPLLPLLYGLMLPSGNDAAIALAQHVAGTRSRFIAMMNDLGGRLGLRCSHFNTVSGIVDQDNYSCATDLAILTRAVLAQPLLARIVATRSVVLPFPIKGGKLYLYSHNPLMLLRYPGIDGIKTGYTDVSGPCIVATARRGRAWLGVVLLNSADRIDQAKKLLNAGFAKLR